MPERALAGGGPHMSAIFSGTDPRNGSFYINLETLAGGMGARPNHDGIDAVRVHASGSSNLPVEALEIAYPLRVERYSLWDGRSEEHTSELQSPMRMSYAVFCLK